MPAHSGYLLKSHGFRGLCGHGATYGNLKMLCLVLALPLTRPKAMDNLEGFS